MNRVKNKFPKVYAALKAQNIADHWSVESRASMAALNHILRGCGLPDWDGGVKVVKVLRTLERKL